MFEIFVTGSMVDAIARISQVLGQHDGILRPKPQPQLRRQNRIKTIKDSLAIEGNSLDLEQVSAVFDHKRVLGPKKEILEVQNAIRVYEHAVSFNPTQLKDFLKAHHMMMAGLLTDAGKFRSGQIGILKGSEVAHVAPPAKRVHGLMQSLFEFLKTSRNLHPLIKACLCHYEIEFIHPFSDGNGRMGRLWQHILLTRHHPLFEYTPVESIIRRDQKKYYRALELSDKQGNAGTFVEFALGAIATALKDYLDDLRPGPVKPADRLATAQTHFNKQSFGRKDYLKLFKGLSTASASRDLALGISLKRLNKSGDKALSRYQFCNVLTT